MWSIIPLIIVIAFCGCDSIPGRYAVDVEATLAGIHAVPSRAQKKHKSLDAYKAAMQTWLRTLSLTVETHRNKRLELFPVDYSFVVNRYFGGNRFAAGLRATQDKDGNEFEVLQIVSGVPSMKEGTVEFGGGYCTWHRPSWAGYAEWPIRFKKQ